ncbi:MAG: hypothetical protein ACRC9O_02215 [Plesiomonas sp.]|uniref:hypothetical protein n=1 Tax=Plesiomonas sp. TaxID=2486279 RepID=UPI003F405732
MSQFQAQAQAVGFIMGNGKKKASSDEYSFSKLLILVKGADFKNSEHNIRKAGYEPQEIPCAFDEALLKKAKEFDSRGLFPLLLNIDVRPMPTDMTKTIIVDFTPVSVSSSAQSPVQGK